VIDDLLDDIVAETRARVLESARRAAHRLVAHAPSCASITEDGVRVVFAAPFWTVTDREGRTHRAVTADAAETLAERALLAGRVL
jgi:hypothetical protein